MTDKSASTPDLGALHSLAELREQPFHSDVPIVGGLIAWFRSVWNGVSTKWYVRPMMAQQTAYNETLLAYLGQIEARSRELRLLADDLDGRIAAQDREQTHLVRDLGEATVRIIQLQAMLEALEAQEATAGERRP